VAGRVGDRLGRPVRRPGPGQLDAGADSVILHGATPSELAPVLDAWRAIRPSEQLAGLPTNPGRTR
jgi:5,10-methylenetetrahydromethanopterin reductase